MKSNFVYLMSREERKQIFFFQISTYKANSCKEQQNSMRQPCSYTTEDSKNYNEYLYDDTEWKADGKRKKAYKRQYSCYLMAIEYQSINE
mgnify:CR=1 FL=1